MRGPAEYHREVGHAAGRLRIDRLVAVGRHADQMADGAIEGGSAARPWNGPRPRRTASERLAGTLGEGDVVLVKGSRAAHMEDIVQALRSRG